VSYGIDKYGPVGHCEKIHNDILSINNIFVVKSSGLSLLDHFYILRLD